MKNQREGSFASYFTDIVIGDELIMIDAIPVDQLTFDEAMKFLKIRLTAAKETSAIQSPIRSVSLLPLSRPKKLFQRAPSIDTGIASHDNVTLTFLTLEERLRRLRRAAVSKNATGPVERRFSQNILNRNEESKDPASLEMSHSRKLLLVDTKIFFQSVFIFLRVPDSTNPPHRIINRSLHWIVSMYMCVYTMTVCVCLCLYMLISLCQQVYYRQRGCDSHRWNSIAPGETASYTWEEPTKPKKLSVRVGSGKWFDSELDRQSSFTSHETKKGRPLFSFQFIDNEEQGHFGATKTGEFQRVF